MKYSRFIRIVAAILTLAFFTQSVPMFVVAEEEGVVLSESLDEDIVLENTSDEDVVYTMDELTDDVIVGELTEQRDATTKYFRLNNGTYVAAIYDSPVHELDADGNWIEIDNRLSDTGDEYENSNRATRIKFSKNPQNGKLYTIKGDNYQIKWALNNIRDSAKEAKKQDFASNSNQSKLTAKSNSETVLYEDVMPGVSLQYQITGGGLKENILLADSSAAQVFEFDLKTTHLEVAAEDNTVVFRHTDGSIVYTMSAPWMMDANGLTSDKIALTVTGENNHYTVTLSPDMEWLASAAYPVVIDPILATSLTGSAITNNTVLSGTEDNPEEEVVNKFEHGVIVVGREKTYGICRGMLKFDLPTAITSADRVIFASLTLTKAIIEEEDSVSITVNLHQITSSVNFSTITFADFDNKYSDLIMDSQIIEVGTDNDADFPVEFNITTAVRDWYQNGNNYGVTFVRDNETLVFNQYVSFYTDRNPKITEAKNPMSPSNTLTITALRIR